MLIINEQQQYSTNNSFSYMNEQITNLTQMLKTDRN